MKSASKFCLHYNDIRHVIFGSCRSVSTAEILFYRLVSKCPYFQATLTDGPGEYWVNITESEGPIFLPAGSTLAIKSLDSAPFVEDAGHETGSKTYVFDDSGGAVVEGAVLSYTTLHSNVEPYIQLVYTPGAGMSYVEKATKYLYKLISI